MRAIGMYFSNRINKKVIVILATELVMIVALMAIYIQKRNNCMIYSFPLDSWSSRTISYDSGWHADESLWKDGLTELGANDDLLYGGYMNLPKGEYIVAVDYECDNNQEFYINCFENNNYIDAEVMRLPYTNTSVRNHFRVLKDLENVEVRIKYNGHGYIDISGITVASSAILWVRLLICVFLVSLIVDICIFTFPLLKTRRVCIEKTNLYISRISVLLVFLVNIIFLYTHWTHIDNDMASNMIAATHANKQRAFLILDDWFGSTGATIVGQITEFRLGALFCPNNWRLARMISIGATLLILICVCLYTLIKAEIIKREFAGYAAAIIIMPFGVWNLWLVSFGGFYLSYFVVEFVLFYIAWRFVRFEKVDLKTTLVGILCVIYIMYSSFSGTSTLAFVFFPFCSAALITAFFRIHNKQDELCKESASLRLIISAISIMGIAMLNFIVYVTLIESRYGVIDSSSRIWLYRVDLTKLIDSLSAFFSLFGYQNVIESYFAKTKLTHNLFSLGGIMSAVGIFISGLVVFSAIRLVKKYSRLTIMQQMVVSMFWSCFIFYVLLFSLTEQFEYNFSNYHWTPIVPMAIAVLIIEIETEEFRYEATRGIAFFMVTMMFLGTSVATMDQYSRAPIFTTTNLFDAAHYLEDREYTQGFGTFDYCNVITEFSNGNIEMWEICGVDSLEIREWLQKKSHKRLPEGKVFMMIGPNEINDGCPYINDDMSNVIYKDSQGLTIIEMDL